MLTALFLCSPGPNEILASLKPEWNERTGLSLKEKISFSGLVGISENLFPSAHELSEGIDKERFALSHLLQPDLFLRLRPGKEKSVTGKLHRTGIPFQGHLPDCLVLPSASKIEDIIDLDKEAVVQDYSSQRVGELLSAVRRKLSDRVWDCCAGSGGKSIMLYDLDPNIELTVSDIRESILNNLKKRFKAAGIKRYKSLVIDLTKENIQHSPKESFRTIINDQYSIIIADVPCTGSGTWGRTPEQLVYFDEEKVEEYASLQKKIIANVVPFLQPGGHLLYSTCSVFRKENEGLVEYITQGLPSSQAGFHFQLKEMKVLKGYTLRADTLFATLLQKPL